MAKICELVFVIVITICVLFTFIPWVNFINLYLKLAIVGIDPTLCILVIVLQSALLQQCYKDREISHIWKFILYTVLLFITTILHEFWEDFSLLKNVHSKP